MKKSNKIKLTTTITNLTLNNFCPKNGGNYTIYFIPALFVYYLLSLILYAFLIK